MPGLAADVTVELLRDSGTVASARVTSVGHRVVLHSRDLDVLVAGRSGGDLRTVAARLADDGWTLDVADDDGPILRLGAVPTHVWHRLATGSRHVQVLRWRAAARLK
ncbi:hypothetical protein, partial [Aeromicrobium sp. CnD17-E]|uniref:hypothetical protein n=1 Tax=Aeromicrobium sp. CnD17-E TaxID=2954487 RepID=UPI00209833D4